MYVYGATRQVWVVKAAHHPLPCWRSGALPGLLWQGEAVIGASRTANGSN